MQLIYRGHSYTCHERTDVRPYPPSISRSDSSLDCQPRAINWRYRLLGTAQVEMQLVKLSTASHSMQLRAINWRYRIPVEG